MSNPQRRRASLAAGIIAAILLMAAAHRAAGELIFAPRFASPDASEVVAAYFTARQWGYRGLSERALAPEVRKSLHAPNRVRPLIDDPFLARGLAVSAPRGDPTVRRVRRGAALRGDLPLAVARDHRRTARPARLVCVRGPERWRSVADPGPGDRAVDDDSVKAKWLWR